MPLSDRELAKSRRRLEKLLALLVEDIQGWESEVLELGSNREDTEDDAPLQAYAEEFALHTLSRDLHTVQEIEDALDRIERGEYGWCEECDDAIPPIRLRAIPQARYCVKCAAQVPDPLPPPRLRFVTG